MKKQTEEKPFRTLGDAELIELLHTAGDNLPREVIDEFMERGHRMIPFLFVIVSDKTGWTRPLPEWWAVVHASYILGAYETAEAMPGLLAALRWSDAFDCEWVTEDLPGMFGRLGKAAYGPLLAVVRDIPAGWGARSIALSGMAGAALTAPFLKESFLEFAARLVAEPTEALPLRQTAANILLDFRSKTHRKALIKFGKEEAQRKEEIPHYEGAFYDWEVDEFLEVEGSSADLEFYERDWLVFYDAEERERRHDYWAEEQKKSEAEREPEQAGEEAFEPERYFSQCPCGSGRSFRDCCMRKIH
jgi:hypothetical protein